MMEDQAERYLDDVQYLDALRRRMAKEDHPLKIDELGWRLSSMELDEAARTVLRLLIEAALNRADEPQWYDFSSMLMILAGGCSRHGTSDIASMISRCRALTENFESQRR